MSNTTRNLAVFGLSLLMPLSFATGAIADGYQPWLSVEDAKEFCNTQEMQDMTQVNAFHNEATVNNTTTTPDTTTEQNIQAQNTGWGMQTIGSMSAKDCSAVIQAEAHRYATYQQAENVRYVNDSNLRQGLLGNMLAW
ncbi:hypothetical protein NIES970_19820 [[Synechococcus] sp. NIES-970]|nr:hypothetical protein NIES970_19820 [[Synechococcus] sp. NIES-970]